MRFTFIVLILTGLFSTSMMGQQQFEKEWQKVGKFVDSGLPQSALQVVDSIYAVAREENNSVQFLKAALYQVRLRSGYQEGFMENSIAQFQREALEAAEPVKQVLNSILAELYWRYYRGNRMKILDRTFTSYLPDPEDITTWDLRTLVEKATECYLASLENPSLLQNTSLQVYDPILETATGSREYRPTLYDFLAHRALDYFMNDEASLTRPAEGFELDEPAYFLPSGDFSLLEISTPAEASMKYHAIGIFQGLLAFHQADGDPIALIDADLKRLQYVWNHSVLTNKRDLYIGALQNLRERYASHPSSTEATYELATVYSIRGGEYDPFSKEEYRWDLKKSKELCEEAIRRFPQSEGAKNCRMLSEQLTTQELQITIRHASIPSEPFLASVRYKNIDTVYFRIIRIDPEENRKLRQGNREETIIAKYLQLTPEEFWEQPLPDEGDMQPHRVQLKIPGTPRGFYILLASASPAFETETSPLVYAPFWMTDISYTSNRSFDGKTEVYVLDREEGSPMKGVTATTFVREYDYSTRSYHVREQNTYVTDKDGYIAISGDLEKTRSFYIKFSKKNDQYFTENYFYIYPEKPEAKARDITYFFTDRAIYRPGQTIYFKGILLGKDGDKHHIRPGEGTLVALYDVNNQKISEILLTTNEFGSFNGAFTAPEGVLTGMMQIRNESGRTTLRVEEYKRPRFKVDIQPLEGNYRLNEMVTVTGEAMAYAGNPVDGAAVKYRVVRETRFPFWRSRWYRWPEGESMEITSGETATNEEGAFNIIFKAIPDLKTNPKNQPVFNYTVYVDVTDINGETHSSEQSVSVSDRALYINTNIPAELDITGNNTFTINTENLNGRPVTARGSIKIYPLLPPGDVLRDRKWDSPDVFVMDEKEFKRDFPKEIFASEDDPEGWEREKPVFTFPFDTEVDSLFAVPGLSTWDPGIYLLEIQALDAFGEMVTLKHYLTLFNPGSDMLPGKDAFFSFVTQPPLEPGDTARVLIGSAEKEVRVLYEVVNKDQLVSRQWLELDREMMKLEVPVEESYRGNFSVRFMFVRGNRSYSQQEFITVPYTNKELELRLETFRDKLVPGQEEEWRIRISGKQGDRVTAELLASMYDASLNAFAENKWPFSLYQSTSSGPSWNVNSAFTTISGKGMYKKMMPYDVPSIRTYDRLNWFGFTYYGQPGLYRDRMVREMAMPGMAKSLALEENVMAADTGMDEEQQVDEPAEERKETPATPDVPVRRNFEETAFFFPEMMTDDKGEVILKFKMPESLTAWKFMGLAYTKDLKTGYVEKQAVTSKELMVMPNPPRFFREGDKISFSSKVTSLSKKTLEGTVTAEFFDAFTMRPVDDMLANVSPEREFSIEKGKSLSFTWDVTIPEGMEAIVYRVVAVSDDFSDGEEMAIPVLPNRMLVTETLPLPVRGKGTKNFSMTHLVNSGSSRTIKDYRLTLEFTSHPAWYAVQALPYLMEEEEESASALFLRLYANSLAGWIANSSPGIRQVFESWKNISPEALLSNLQKNEALKSVLLQETPWVMQAIGESEQKRRIALLFDLNRMANEQLTALSKLKQMQLPNGGWPWFKGMRDSPYTTQNIVSGIGKLQHLGVINLDNDPVSMNMVRRGIYYMDQRMKEYYEDLVERTGKDIDKDHLSPIYIQYLYGRSYFMDRVPLQKQYAAAFSYFQGQAEEYWLARNKYMQGMIALALHRLGETEVPAGIIASLKEHALSSEELGMYWRDTPGYYWHELPVERQALLIEAFAEVAGDMVSVEDMKVWLLKQKQTQMWKTGKATADAVYALLLQGADMLVPDQQVEVTLGRETVDPFRRDDVTVEAGTGYFQAGWDGEAVKPSMGKVKVVKKDEGVAWGALYWQYFEDLEKIQAAKTPLSLEKKLFREDLIETGPVLSPVDDGKGLEKGDKIVVRIVLRVDRDMEFVHMKDMRAAALEPVNFLSGYRYQGGLGYYEAPKDASMNFYFDYLRKGTYVFEYALLANQKGEFSNGIATIQCHYAPEFSSHSEGLKVKIE